MRNRTLTVSQGVCLPTPFSGVVDPAHDMRQAHNIYGHCLICDLQALPLFIDRLADPFTAVVVSVSMVLVFGGWHSIRSLGIAFLTACPSPEWMHRNRSNTYCWYFGPLPTGEILPQAICSRYGLKVSAFPSCMHAFTAPIPLQHAMPCTLSTSRRLHACAHPMLGPKHPNFSCLPAGRRLLCVVCALPHVHLRAHRLAHWQAAGLPAGLGALGGWRVEGRKV